MDSARKFCLSSALAISVGACDTLSEWNAHPDSYFTRDESVDVVFYDEKSYEDLFTKRKGYDELRNESVEDDRCVTEAVPPYKEPAKRDATDSERSFVVAPITAAAAAAVAELVVDQAVKALEEEASRYTARFTGRYIGQFYKADGSLKYDCFSIERKVGKKGDLAMFFIGAIRPSADQTAVQIRPLIVEYPKLKAKALRTDKTAAVAITLDIRSAWKDANNDFHNQQTASVALYNQKVRIGEQKPQRATDFGWGPSDWLTPVIPSAPVNTKVESGNFSLTVTVVETTETGADIVGVVADTLRQNKSEIVNVIVNPAKQN